MKETEKVTVIGTFEVITAFEAEKAFEYAAAYQIHAIEPQVAPVEVVWNGSGWIRVGLKSTIVRSWQKEEVGREAMFFIWAFNTWDFANNVRDGYKVKGEVVAKLTLAEGYEVRQHVDSEGRLCFYPKWNRDLQCNENDESRPMLRIVKADGSAVGPSKKYHSYGPEGAYIHTEWML